MIKRWKVAKKMLNSSLTVILIQCLNKPIRATETSMKIQIVISHISRLKIFFLHILTQNLNYELVVLLERIYFSLSNLFVNMIICHILYLGIYCKNLRKTTVGLNGYSPVRGNAS